MTRAVPQRYIPRSRGLERVRAQAEGVFRGKTELLAAVTSGDFRRAQQVTDADDSMSALEIALAHRWVKLERLYRFNFQHPTSA